MPQRALSRRLLLVAVCLLTAAAGAGCSSDTESTDSTTTTTTAAAPPMATPLIGSVLASPVPVTATDGRTHLAYELVVTNTLGGNATLNSLTARAGDRDLLTLAGDNLKYWTRILGNRQVPTNVLAPGQTATIWIDLELEHGTEPPADITHSVNLNVTKPIPGLVPSRLTQEVAPVSVSERRAVSIAAPLDGPNWFNANGCCRMSAHRTALNPVNGKLWASERFAIDYVQLTEDFRLFNGDPTKLESYPYFGAPVHAVAEGTVVTVVDNLPEQVPTKTPSGLPLDQYGGNHVIQDLGDGTYAFYAHLKPGSITVQPGDTLTTGQQIGAVGNSGNSDAPHLHFHLMDNPDFLAADGVPFVINSFRLTQQVTSPEGVDTLFTGQPAPLRAGFAARDVTDAMPLDLDVMDYAVAE